MKLHYAQVGGHFVKIDGHWYRWEDGQLEALERRFVSQVRFEPIQMTKKEYNGWYNYGTWLVALHLDNDQNTQAELHNMARGSTGDTDTQVYNLGLAVKAWVTETLIPDLGCGLAADLINAMLSEVNWREIARNAITGVEDAITGVEE